MKSCYFSWGFKDRGGNGVFKVTASVVKGRPSGKSCSRGGGAEGRGGTQSSLGDSGVYAGNRKEIVLISLSSQIPVSCWWVPG